MIYKTVSKEIIDNNSGFLGRKMWMALLSVVIVSLSAGIFVAQAQPAGGTSEPKPFDRIPVGKPEEFSQGGHTYRIFKNKDGIVVKAETYEKYEKYDEDKCKLLETRYVQKIHENGKPAEQTIVTGQKDKNGLPVNVTKQEEVFLDPKGKKLKTKTYTDFDESGKATKREIWEEGKEKIIEKRVKDEWLSENELPKPSPKSSPKPGPKPLPPLGETNKVTAAEAERRIAAHIKIIETRVGEMVAAYYYAGAQRTLEESMKRAGVSPKSMTYADPWGKSGIGLFWSEYVKSFYAYHLDALNKSRTIVQNRRYAVKSDLEYLDNGINKWKEHEQSFSKDFDSLVDNYTKLALINDAKTANEVKYGSLMSEISNSKPFRSDKYDAVKAEWALANKSLDQQARRCEDALQTIKDMIAKKAKERFFSSIDEKQGGESNLSEIQNRYYFHSP